MIPEKGDFTRISAPGLLLHIAESGLTGILYLKQEETLKALHFDGGHLVWAISNSVEDKLERILLEEHLVDELTLNRIRRQQSGTALGKSLIEKGLLSVEQLVECTRLQFKRILDDVLAWNRGGFQIIASPPPENLFKMDLDLVSMVFNFVLENVSVDQVHQRIPDLSVRPESRADDKRVQAFNLSQKKREFLSHFSGRESIEDILSRYADSHRDALMKVVYFFLLADLVRLPGEPAPMDDPLGEPQQAFSADLSPESSATVTAESETVPRRQAEDGSMPQATDDKETEAPDAVGAPESVLDLDLESAEPAPEFYSFTDLNRKQSAHDMVGPESLDGADSHVAETEPDSFAFDKEKEPQSELDFSIADEVPVETSVDDLVKRETRQGRQVNMLLIMIFAILVTSGAIFLLLTSDTQDIPASDTKPTVQKVAAENKKSGERDTLPAKEQATAKSPAMVDTRADAGKKSRIKDTDPQKAEQSEKKTPATIRPVAGGDAPLQLLRSGRYLEAAQAWRSQMAQEMSGFSILLELDCLTASVGAAFKRIHEPDKFFLLPRKRGNRNCFLVMWGRFSSEDSALEAMRGLPAYFLNQDPPARVIDLATYR
ncbi:MAG TPA: hypothetical protein ENN40_03180 [Candidatus Aminicenantes bacterium]|nr:hypothetical protein [Candidatus Aminicenantes bacterium]